VETMLLAGSKHARISAGDEEINSHFSYADDAGALHQVWLLDAVSTWNQLAYAKKKNLRGCSLWRLGQEDQGICRFLGQPQSGGLSPDSLRTIWAEPVVQQAGEGELLRVSSAGADGRRELLIKDKRIKEARYESLPSYFKVEKFGHVKARRIALTF